MRRSAQASTAAAVFIGMSFATLTSGCTDQPYSSPQQQAQNACRAFGPKTLSGMAIGGLAGGVGGAGIGAAAGGGRGALIANRRSWHLNSFVTRHLASRSSGQIQLRGVTAPIRQLPPNSRKVVRSAGRFDRPLRSKAARLSPSRC